MNVVTSKVELREYRKLNELIISKQIIFTNLSLRLANLRAMKQDNPKTAEKLARAEREHSQRKAELEGLVRRSEDLRRTIDSKLQRLDELSAKILRLKYYKGMTLLLVSNLLHYEYTWFCKLHAKALREYSLL